MSKRPSKPIAKYAVVERGYLEEETGGVLVPASQVRDQHRRRRREPIIRFGEDLPDDCDEGRDLGVVHGAADGRIFADEVEEEFDQDFIMQMMTGEGVEGEDVGLLEEVAPELADEQYPRHVERRAEEKQFDKMMREFLMDEDIEEDDPRVHGALPVEEFYRPMQEFLQDHAGYSMLHEGEFVRHAGLINHFKLRADRNDTEEEVAPDGTTFVAMPEKHSDPAGDFFRQTEGLQEITRRMFRDGRLREDQLTIAQAVGEVMERVIGPDGSVTQAYYDDAEWLEDDGKGQRRPAFSVAPDAPQVVRDAARNFARRGDRMDCETVLTTMTDMYNRPNVITTGASVRATTVRSKAPAAHAPGLLEATSRKPAVAAASVAAAPKAAPSAIAPSAKRTVVIAPGEILPRGPLASAPVMAMDDDDDDDFDGMDDDMGGADNLTLQEQLLMLSVVPKGETKEEKKQRQQLVKQLQRERRAAKKELRGLYASTEVSQKSQSKQSKNDKATMKMSAI